MCKIYRIEYSLTGIENNETRVFVYGLMVNMRQFELRERFFARITARCWHPCTFTAAHPHLTKLAFYCQISRIITKALDLIERFKYYYLHPYNQTSRSIDKSEQNKEKKMEHKIKILVIGVMIAAITIGVIIVGKEE